MLAIMTGGLILLDTWKYHASSSFLLRVLYVVKGIVGTNNSGIQVCNA